MTPALYIEQRNKYLPKNIKIVFILESPPTGTAYFYNPNGKTSELLFWAFMHVIGITPLTKEEGLQHFANQGWLIIDPIYKPVNTLPDKMADELLLKNYTSFKTDLENILPNKEIPPIIVKANILRLFEDKLVGDGFNVVNQRTVVPFPMHYHITDFVKKIKSLVKNIV